MHRDVIAGIAKSMEQRDDLSLYQSVEKSSCPSSKDGWDQEYLHRLPLFECDHEECVYPLPRIDDILDTLGGNKYFTSLDSASGYWQVSMNEESAPKSAFVIHCGLFEFVRMPFGMCNTAVTFQRLIEVVLTGLLWKECFAYIDDVLVSSPDFGSHLAHLQEVFHRLRKAGLRLKTKESSFLKSTVSYLGHLLTSDGIQPDPEKTSRVIQVIQHPLTSMQSGVSWG